MEDKYNVLLLKFENEQDRLLYRDDAFRNKSHEDAGFDLHVPEEVVVPPKAKGMLIALNVRCAMKAYVDPVGEKPVGYMLVPRSSIIKTPLRMANSIGIIDKGYRGIIQMPVDNLSEEPFTIEKGQRLCQIVSFNGNQIIADNVDCLPDSKRGEGGFGSTGK